MAHHEDKHCPRCNGAFECKVGTILQCQCSGLTFTEIEKDYIRLNYQDCLCRNCLLVMKHEMSTTTAQHKMQVLLANTRKK